MFPSLTRWQDKRPINRHGLHETNINTERSREKRSSLGEERFSYTRKIGELGEIDSE
jgi:hypothetical protein